MSKIISIVVLVISVLLFPPAALAFISQGAIPGDGTYPIKRGLESVILAVASVNPTTKAWFSVDVSNRRFKETTELLAKGHDAAAQASLNELISQTSVAAQEINNVSNSSQKQQLQEDLHKSVAQYITALVQTPAQNTYSQSSYVSTNNYSQASYLPNSTQAPEPTIYPSSLPVSSSYPSTPPQVTPTPEPTAPPIQTPAPTAPPVPADVATICAHPDDYKSVLSPEAIANLCSIYTHTSATQAATVPASTPAPTQPPATPAPTQSPRPSNNNSNGGVQSRFQTGGASVQNSTQQTASNCRDNPENPPSGYIWKADCSKQCDTKSQCPVNTSLPKNEQGNSNWCYGFKGPAHSSADWRCLMLQRQ